MKIALIAGPWSTTVHGPLHPEKLYKERALTGSESAFFNLAHGLAERGHEVNVYCDTEHESFHSPGLGGANVFSLETGTIPLDLDAYIALNEPDLLERAPASGSLRICWQQLGDFPYHSNKGFDRLVDRYIALSPHHLDHIVESAPTFGFKAPRKKWSWIPNSFNPEHFTETGLIRDPFSMVWLSSPDRGLHHLLSLFPEIKREIPLASLRIFYRLDEWLEIARTHDTPNGDRARYIEECLKILGRHGENGVHVMGMRPNTEVARELLSTRVFPYTYDGTMYTETFSVSTLESMAAGCLPILSDQDSLPTLYGSVAEIIRPTKRKQWIETIVRAMTDEKWWTEQTTRTRQFAQSFTRQVVATLWERVLEGQDPMLAYVPAYLEFSRRKESTAQQRTTRSADHSTTRSQNHTNVPEAAAEETPIQEHPRRTTKPGYQFHAAASRPHHTPWRPLRIAVMMGKVGSSVHGKLDVPNIFDTRENFVTGTVSGFFNIAWGLAERGHQVDAFCDAKERVIHSTWGGANFYPIDEVTIDVTYDVYISINEPDLLCEVPREKLKLCVTWLNDFSFSEKGFEIFDDSVDFYVSPSWTLGERLIRNYNIARQKLAVIPLCINPEFHDEAQSRRPGSIAYCSSPDRGLHILLSLFPQIRERVPGANLRIYYRLLGWLRDWKRSDLEKRAQTIRDVLERLGTNGENGIHLMDIVPPRIMAKELGQTEVLAYPCDPIMFTEGFSVAVMDACTAGAIPIISGADALPEIYWNGPHVIFGKPEEKTEEWLNAITMALTNKDFAASIRTSAKTIAREHTRQKIARRWENFIMENIE